MTKKKYQVFISSTYTDLKEERMAVTMCLLNNGFIPVGMEQFPASGMEQMEYIEKMLDDCDYYILILAGRYGSIDKADGIGYTEKEYNYAIEKGIPVLSFVLRDVDSLPLSKSEKKAELRKKLACFRSKVMSNKMVKLYSDIGDLREGVSNAINRITVTNPMPGWIRGGDGKKTEKEELTDDLNSVEEAERLIKKADLLLMAEDYNDIESIIQMYRTAISLNPNNAEYHSALATILDEREVENSTAAIINSLTCATELSPNNAKYWVELGDFWLYKNSCFDKAKEAYLTAFQIKPNDGAICYKLGDACFYCGHYSEALAYLEKAEALNPSLKCQERRADVLLKLNREDEAIAIMKKVFEKDFSSTELLFKIAKYMADHGKEDEAVSYISQAEKKKQDNYLMKAKHIDFLFDMGRYEDALVVAKELAREGTDYKYRRGDCQWNLARIYLKLNQLKKARTSIDYALQLYPNENKYQSVLSEIEYKEFLVSTLEE